MERAPKKSTGIQKLVYKIIEAGKMEQNYITRRQISEEAKKTSLAAYDVPKNKGRNKTKSIMDVKIDQAIHMLKKKGLIKQYNKKGRWVLTNEAEQKTVLRRANKYKPVVCRALQQRDDRFYCPVRNCYIGDPSCQCELYHTTDMQTLQKTVVPMKWCYCPTPPTQLELDYLQSKLIDKIQMEIQEEEWHYYEQSFGRGF